MAGDSRTTNNTDNMETIKTRLEGVTIVKPKMFRDSRGYFFESYSQREFDEKVRRVHFVQDNESMSSYGVIRGLHYQKPPYAQSKLVRCVRGAVLDVAVDIRRGSPTYGQYTACLLCSNDEEGRRLADTYAPRLADMMPEGLDSAAYPTGLQLFVPRGFAHGFSVLSETAVFQYKCDEFYHPEAEGGISILDGTLGIDWLVPAANATLSDKDTRQCMFSDMEPCFDYRHDYYPQDKEEEI